MSKTVSILTGHLQIFITSRILPHPLQRICNLNILLMMHFKRFEMFSFSGIDHHHILAHHQVQIHSYASFKNISTVFVRLVSGQELDDILHLTMTTLWILYSNLITDLYGWSSRFKPSSLIEIRHFPPKSKNVSYLLVFFLFIISHSDFLEIHAQDF